MGDITEEALERQRHAYNLSQLLRLHDEGRMRDALVAAISALGDARPAITEDAPITGSAWLPNVGDVRTAIDKARKWGAGCDGDTGAVHVHNLLDIIKSLTSSLGDARPAPPAWQDIATAPKDGTDILVADCHGLVGQAYWNRADLVWWWLDQDPVSLPIKGWLPLPAAPLEGS